MMVNELYIPVDDEYITINAKIARNKLVQMLIDTLIPWTECFRKCGWVDDCKHIKLLKNRGADQKCRVMTKILENLINCTYKTFSKLNNRDKERYLLGVVKYIELVIKVHGWMGATYNTGVVKYFGDLAPRLYGGLLRERREMDEIAYLLKNIKCFNTEIPVYLVEGVGDQTLLRAFTRHSRMANFNYLRNIDIIFSRSNVRKGRIDLLIKNKIRRGERTIVVLDGDGSVKKAKNSLMKLWKHKLIKKKDIFVFKYNIEKAFPPDMLTKAMENYVSHYKLKVTVDPGLISNAVRLRGDFVANCESVFSINIKKIVLDRILGYQLAEIVKDRFGDIMNRMPPYHKHEIFRFLRFVAMHR